MSIKVRHEINILCGTLTADGDSSSVIQIDTTKHNATCVYHFEVVGKRASGTCTVTLHDAANNVHATCSITSTTDEIVRAEFSAAPDTGAADYHVNVAGGSTTPVIRAARVLVMQTCDSLTATETQIEIGNKETGLVNTSAAGLAAPKYWKYVAANWDATKVFKAEVVWKKTDTATTTVSYTANDSWTPNVSQNAVIECFGAGGGGGGSSSTTFSGGGGGGGARSKKTVAVTSGTPYAIAIGTAGTVGAGASGGNGGNTTFATTTVVAAGGKGGGGGAGGTGGAGGAVVDCTGDVGEIFAGGKGGNGITGASSGGGGGSSGGTATGNDGTIGDTTDATNAGGVAPAGGYNGGVGGAFHNDGVTPTDLYAGGGGGSGHKSGGDETGGAGRPGLLKLTKIDATPTVTILLQEENAPGSFTGWATAATIVSASATSGAVTRSRSSAFTPKDGYHYRLAASISNGTGHSYDIYNAKVVVEQSNLDTVTYLCDASVSGPSDPNNVWTDDSMAFTQSNDVATTTTTGETNYLQGYGTTAPSSSSYGIVQCRIRIYYGCSGSNVQVYIYNGETLISTASFGAIAGTQLSAYGPITAPEGGWTWTIISQLGVKFYLQSGGTSASVGYAEIEVTRSVDGITKLEPQYLLANTTLAAGTALQGALTKWDSAEWSSMANTYYHAVDAADNSTSHVTLDQADGGGAVTGSEVVHPDNHGISGSLTMPGNENLDCTATVNP